MSLALWNEVWSEYSDKAKDYWALVEVYESQPEFQTPPTHRTTAPSQREANLPAHCQVDSSPIDFADAFVRALLSSYYTRDSRALGPGLQTFKSELRQKVKECDEFEDAMAELTSGDTPISAFVHSFADRVKLVRQRRSDPSLRTSFANPAEPVQVRLPALKQVLAGAAERHLTTARERLETIRSKVGLPADEDEAISIARSVQRLGHLLEAFGDDGTDLEIDLRRARAVTKVAAMTSHSKRQPLSLEEAKMVREHENLVRLSFETLYNDVTTSVESVDVQDFFVDVDEVIQQSALRGSLELASSRVKRAGELLASDHRILNEILDSVGSQTKILKSLLAQEM